MELLDFYKEKDHFYETPEKAQGKAEYRAYYLVRPTRCNLLKEWKGIKNFIRYINTITSSRIFRIYNLFFL